MPYICSIILYFNAMKKILIRIIPLLLSLNLNAQKEINISLNFIHAGKNLALKHSWLLTPKKEIALGLKYHINRNPAVYFNNNYTYKAIHAHAFGQHFGPNLTYWYGLISSKSKTKFRFFYDFQYTYAGTKNVYYFYTRNPNPDGKEEIYTRIDKGNLPINMYEQNIGLNVKLPLTEKLKLNLSLGTGIVIFVDNNNNVTTNSSNVDWEFNPVYSSIGLTFQYKDKKVKKK